MKDEPNVRRPKVDPADARDTSETFLPGQIPVADADTKQEHAARVTEQQPDPVAASQAVNPELMSEDVKRGAAGSKNPAVTPAEDQKTGE